MTVIENWKTVESGDTTQDELLELKKKLADEVVDKMVQKDPDILSLVLRWSITNYLVDDGSLGDLLRDKVLIWGLWESAWVITPTLKKYREMFSKANTKSELDNLRTNIFNDIWWVEQVSSTSTQETTGNTSSSTGSSSTESSASSNGSDEKSNKESESKSENTADSKNTDNSKKDKEKKSDDSKKNKEKKSDKSSSDSSASSNEKAKEGTGKSHEIDKFDITVSAETKKIWESLKWKEKPDLEPFGCAMKAYKTEKAEWHLKNTKYLTVVDFTKNMQTDKRFFVINLDTNTVEYSEKCGHGEWSGGKEWATSFSNKSWSHQSSLWASITTDKSRSNGKWTWVWQFPKWQEKSNNATRWIAIHPVKSLTYSSWKPTSEGCYTIPQSQSYVNEILSKINWWSLVFAYAKKKDYFAQSDYFKQSSDGSVVA